MPDGALDRYTLRCPKGTVLFEEGQPGDRMYVIQSGGVQVFKKVGGSRVLLAQLGQGDCVGEMAIIDGQPRSADAVVTSDASLVALDASTFEGLIRENGEVAARIMRKLSQRLRDANRQIEALLSHNELAASVHLLRSIAGEAGPDGCRPLPPDAGVKLLAMRAGLTPGEARVAWERLCAAGAVREAEAGALLAPEPLLEDFLTYLELKQKYDPLTARELSEMTGLSEDEVHRVIRRVLDTRLEGGDVGLADSYRQFLTLKKRFEYLAPRVEGIRAP